METRDRFRNLLDFTGKTIESITIHNKTDQPAISIKDYFTYDHMGRLVTQQQQIDGGPAQLIASNSYDALGQLVRKNVGGETAVNGYTYIQKIHVTFDGTVTSGSTAYDWSSRLKTKGKIMEDGGILFKVEGINKHTRVGLVKPVNGNSSNMYLDYGIYLRFINNAYRVYIVNNGVDQSTSRTYSSGDIFKVERVGNQVKYYQNSNSAFATVTYVGNGEALTGKVSFSDPDGGLSGLRLYGPKIDKILQNITYKYNIRGWLTDINDVDPGGGDILREASLFNFRINYNRVEDNTAVQPLYNGNISQTFWKTSNTDKQTRGYAYSYDALNRIISADSYHGNKLSTLAQVPEHDLQGISYDRNGNIQSLNRTGADEEVVPNFGQWDNLVYAYNGNQLTKVTDLATGAHKDFGFKDGSNTGDDYLYDVNGNMTQDLNKGIFDIKYNHLNLPVEINFDEYSTIPSIRYKYDATGVKLEKSVMNEGIISTQYAGGFIYNNNYGGSQELQFFSHPEGYVEPVVGTPRSIEGFEIGLPGPTYSSYNYVFQYRDIWGNERLSYSDLDLNGSIDPSTEILSEKNYYPYGLIQKGYNNSVKGIENNFQQYQEQEFTEDLELNIHEWKYRVSDPAIGRFWQIDPLAEKYVYNSTYAFQENKLGSGRELEGLENINFDKVAEHFSPQNQPSNLNAQQKQNFKNVVHGVGNITVGTIGAASSIGYIAGTSGAGAALGGGLALGFSMAQIGIGIGQVADAMANDSSYESIHKSSNPIGLVAHAKESEHADLIDAAGGVVTGLLSGSNLKTIVQEGRSVLTGTSTLLGTASAIDATKSTLDFVKAVINTTTISASQESNSTTPVVPPVSPELEGNKDFPFN